jgi:hypothetical protein
MTQRQRPEEALVRLRREVLPPRDPSSSFGIVAVSTVALLFALSSSLLLFHASALQRPLVRTCPAHAAPALPRPTPPPPPSIETCRPPAYRTLPDGRVEVVVELCEPRGRGLRGMASD